MIAYRDFVPRQLSAPNRFGSQFSLAVQGEHETLDVALTAANDWISEEGIQLMNFETVVLPNIWEPAETGANDPSLRTGTTPQWHQFIRVWYHA
jgi:hypothetical protein